MTIHSRSPTRATETSGLGNRQADLRAGFFFCVGRATLVGEEFRFGDILSAMPFQLKNSESLGLGTRRVCRERIGKARAQLRHSDRPAAVHGVRKEIKKLRAIFRLVRGEIGKDAYRNGTKALREAANRLAAPRDARVMLKAFAKLAGRRTKRFDSIGAALKQHLRRETRRFRKDDSAARAKRLLRKTGR